ncbi:hypothetical protein PGT21_003172 [Puccinia graminis f. sp. tritici]|uniref:Uncharacterized protein n=1 Tax=Puccinia graminis f. sp. tritici TaxID=56615 RepID=A0A5B0QN52_PUCGR|nr:hypothetical protein PGT21_003172 [Puccinia graminis f. sp. tritici]
MAHSSSNSVQYTHFPTYRRSLLLRPSMTHSFTESHLCHSSPQEVHALQSQPKGRPTLLRPSKLQRTPLKPCLSPQSPTPSSISRHSKIKDSESRLRKNLSDLESRLDDLHSPRAAIKSSSPSPSLSSLLLPNSSRKPPTLLAGESPERKQPRFDNEILGIFLKNNGGYLDDSDDSDDDEEDSPNRPSRFSYHGPHLSPLAGRVNQQIAGSSHTKVHKVRSPRQTTTRDTNRRSLSMNVI